MKSIFLLLAAAGAYSLAACSTVSDPAATPAASTPQAGYVTGHVVDAQGKPLKDAEVVVNSTGAYAPNLFGYTDAAGNYRIKLPTGQQTGQYYVRGHASFTYNGQVCRLMLATENDRAFTNDDSPVRDMHLALTGDRSQNVFDSGYFGGTLEVDNHTSNTRAADIEVTLEPVGPLVDGSAGTTLKAQPTGLYARNLPVGNYRITARDKAANQPLTVKNYFYDAGFQATTTGTFEAIQPGGDRYQLIIVVAD